MCFVSGLRHVFHCKVLVVRFALQRVWGWGVSGLRRDWVCIAVCSVYAIGSPYTTWFECTGLMRAVYWCGVWCDAYLVCGVLGFPYTCRVCGMRQVFFMR